jgi:tetratricopeptide (TPR) repeat protein
MCSLFLSLFMVSTAEASDISDMFREHKYQQVIVYFAALPDYQQNEESLYYLALSYLKLKKYDQAKNTIIALYQRDPSFYDYRLQFDLDFAELFEQTDLKKQVAHFPKGELMAQLPHAGHKVVRTSKGLYLYRNGVRMRLSENTDASQVRFINDDLVYVVSDKLTLFSGKQKKFIKALELKGGVERVWVDKVGRVNVKTAEDLKIMNID